MTLRAAHQESNEFLREQIPLRDMSDCLLAVYDQVSRRAIQRCIVRGAHEGSDREDWKAAEDDLFARIPVDFEESGGNLYALVSLPGCAGAEITVAVDECWLLICGDAEHQVQEDAAEDLADFMDGFSNGESGSDEDGEGPKVIGQLGARALRDDHRQRESPLARDDRRHRQQREPGPCAPRPFCVVALRAKVDPERSVAVLCDGLLAIRMGKAGLETPVPRVAKDDLLELLPHIRED